MCGCIFYDINFSILSGIVILVAPLKVPAKFITAFLACEIEPSDIAKAIDVVVTLIDSYPDTAC
jgi:hypothetical protein